MEPSKACLLDDSALTTFARLGIDRQLQSRALLNRTCMFIVPAFIWFSLELTSFRPHDLALFPLLTLATCSCLVPSAGKQLGLRLQAATVRVTLRFDFWKVPRFPCLLTNQFPWPSSRDHPNAVPIVGESCHAFSAGACLLAVGSHVDVCLTEDAADEFGFGEEEGGNRGGGGVVNYSLSLLPNPTPSSFFFFFCAS